MKTSSRFAVAVHILTLAMLARGDAEDGCVTSERMARSVCTHPVVIRRILGSLRQAGLVTSQPGPGGGWRLTRSPERITLLEVYRAVETEPLFAMHHNPPNAACMVGRQMPHALEHVFREAEAAMEQKLAEVTMAEVVDDVVAGFHGCGARYQPA